MQQNRQTNAKAIASLVLSCASMICCVQWSISLVMAVLGIVFGILGLRDDNPNQGRCSNCRYRCGSGRGHPCHCRSGAVN